MEKENGKKVTRTGRMALDLNRRFKKIQEEDLLNWLREEIEAGHISVDQPGWLVFRINKGLLLKSPGTFHRYEESVGEEWYRVHNRFLPRKLHVKNDD